jgi:ceramide glucosyltransferase
MTVLWLIVTAGVIVGTGYYAFSVLAAWIFFRRRRFETPSTRRPPVTLLKPLKGLGVNLERNLHSFCTLDYPDYQILFAAADADDPAIAVVEQLQRRYPERDITLIVNPTTIGTNRKVSNLAHMMWLAKHDIVVISDSDIRVPRNYLEQIVEPFAAPDVGLVTCLYRGVSNKCPPTQLEALFVNTDFMPMVFVAHQVEQFRYAFGATIAIRQAALNAIGGFAAIADHLADDYQLGHQVAARGYRTVLSPLIVETHLDADTWASLVRHQLRWARTHRVCRPGGYFFTILTHGTSWAMAFLLLSGFSPLGWQVFVTTMAVRLLQAATIGGGYIGSREAIRDLWLVPIKDWLLTVLWGISYLSNDVEWAGERLAVGSDGLMAPLGTRRLGVPAAAVVHAPALPAVDGRKAFRRPSSLPHSGRHQAP